MTAVHLTSPKCGMPSTVLSCLCDHHESKYWQFAMRRWRTGEHMTEYMDELICLFRKARPGSQASFPVREVKNQLFSGLPSNVTEIVTGYLDLMAVEIVRKYDFIARQRETLGLSAQGVMEKPLLVVQDKQTGSDIIDTYSEFEQVFAFRDGNRQNRFKDETYTYCNKKGHTEAICFVKRDNNKMTKMAEKVSAAIAEQITATNKKAMESILETLSKMSLKVQGLLLPPEVEVLTTISLKRQQKMKVMTNLILTVESG